jgi:hypothetical protein
MPPKYDPKNSLHSIFILFLRSSTTSVIFMTQVKKRRQCFAYLVQQYDFNRTARVKIESTLPRKVLFFVIKKHHRLWCFL